MKGIALFLLVFGITLHAMADFEKATIYKTNGEVIECLIDVYEPGVLVGNIRKLNCSINAQKVKRFIMYSC